MQEASEDTNRVGPFLKWVGGKRWLVSAYSELLPTIYSTYYEPFLGGGAVFFHTAPENAVLGDLNKRLINCYSAIKTDWKAVLKHLHAFKRLHSDDYYYEIRSKTFKSSTREAAKFIYLNRTCFNGIYRENLKGIFNVPRGTKNSVIFPDDNFKKISSLLSNTRIINSDFEAILNMAGDGDFVFIDPPYTVHHNLNGFIKYNQKIFSWEDQIRLRDAVKSATDRGAMCLITNANHQSVLELYEGLGEMFILNRSSIVSASADGRKKCTEIAIAVGYKPDLPSRFYFNSSVESARNNHASLSAINSSQTQEP